MTRFKNLALSVKQTLIIMLTSSIVLLLACASFVAYDAVTFRRELAESVSALADMIGANCAAAIDFKDPASAAETLAALHANRNIIFACVYDRDGRTFAVYQRDSAAHFNSPVMRKGGEEFRNNLLYLYRPVMRQDEAVGTILLTSDLNGLSSRLMRYVGIAALVLVASLLLALALSNRLQRLVSDPVLHLAKVARAVALDKDYSVRAVKQSDDELGQLVDGFNEMLAQIQERDLALQGARDNLEKRVEERTQELENTHKRLIEASRLSGMAEIATNVLHNVGNVLNSVNVSSMLVVDKVKNSKISGLARASALLQSHQHDLGAFITADERGKLLPAYLVRLSDALQAEQALVCDELHSLRENVDHIKEVVAMQQSYAKVSGVKQIIELSSLVEDSIRISQGSSSGREVEIIRSFESAPPIDAEKHKILQILVNLLRNAKRACDDSAHARKTITVRVMCGAGKVIVSVSDNGVGIPPENLTRIFSHGFTTRKDGHGFGLHSGALAAREMGGSLTAFSDGANKGATFTLELPCCGNGIAGSCQAAPHQSSSATATRA